MSDLFTEPVNTLVKIPIYGLFLFLISLVTYLIKVAILGSCQGLSLHFKGVQETAPDPDIT